MFLILFFCLLFPLIAIVALAGNTRVIVDNLPQIVVVIITWQLLLTISDCNDCQGDV